jgi:hypothetical protein
MEKEQYYSENELVNTGDTETSQDILMADNPGRPFQEPDHKAEEYKIEALKEAFDGERTDVYTKHVWSRPESIGAVTREFVRYHSAERFNVWQKIKV